MQSITGNLLWRPRRKHVDAVRISITLESFAKKIIPDEESSSKRAV